MRSLLFLAVCIAVLVVTNPNEDAHGLALRRWATAQCGGGVAAKLVCGGMMGVGSLAMDYDSYLVLSVGRIGDVRTIGALKYVFVIKDKDLSNSIRGLQG